jgi:hypothetical protein
LHGDPRDKHDNDFIPSDDDSDHGYGHPGVGIGPTTDLPAYASFASDQGTLAGGRRPSSSGKWAREQMGEDRYDLYLKYQRGTNTKDTNTAHTEYKRLRRDYNKKNPHHNQIRDILI